MQAARSFTAGELIFCEEPVALLQALDSRAAFPACGACHAPLGCAALQLAFAAQQHNPESVGDDAARAALAQRAQPAAGAASLPSFSGAGTDSAACVVVGGGAVL